MMSERAECLWGPEGSCLQKIRLSLNCDSCKATLTKSKDKNTEFVDKYNCIRSIKSLLELS